MILTDIRPARDVDAADLSDLTAARQTGPAYWAPDEVDVLVIPTDVEPTPGEARAIRRRLVSRDAADERHLRDLVAAHADPQAPTWARLALAAEIRRYGNPDDLT